MYIWKSKMKYICNEKSWFSPIVDLAEKKVWIICSTGCFNSICPKRNAY